LQQLVQRQSAFKVAAVQRFYSTQSDAQDEAKDEAKEASKENGEAKEAESPEETFKKELEAKNKEIAEMKVSLSRLYFTFVCGTLCN
jgi:hypothetical protein